MNGTTINDDELADDVIDSEPTSKTDTLALRRPDVPITLSELAALKGEALEIVEARVQVLATLRRASIRATSPEDWVLFKAPDDQGGQVVGYLQDCGGDRVRDLWGIEIYDVSRPEKILSNDPRVFHYVITGSGRCKLTRQIVEQIEGGRSSTDDFCRGKSGADLELSVRKAARANLDGNITRELAAMKSVPLQELTDAWVGTTKKTESCRRGRGFGSRVERMGQRATQAGETREAPTCDLCGAQAAFRPAGKTTTGKAYEAFWSCPAANKHPETKWTLDDSKWREMLAQRASAPAEREPGAEG